MLCITNADMDPKNVMWENNVPQVIDLECLDYGNPMADAVVLALQWAGTVTEALDTDKLIAFFAGYLKAYDNGFRGYGALTGMAYSCVHCRNIRFLPGIVLCRIQMETGTHGKIYLDLGFRPMKENLEHSYEGWKMIQALTGHPALAEV